MLLNSTVHRQASVTDGEFVIRQLLEEICNLGRAPEYICQKPSIQKADGTVAVPPARSSHAAEEASSEDEEEEEALHTFSQQQGEPESNRQSVPLELYDAEFTSPSRTNNSLQEFLSFLFSFQFTFHFIFFWLNLSF